MIAWYFTYYVPGDEEQKRKGGSHAEGGHIQILVPPVLSPLERERERARERERERGCVKQRKCLITVLTVINSYRRVDLTVHLLL